jgi:hypothetical protein
VDSIEGGSLDFVPAGVLFEQVRSIDDAGDIISEPTQHVFYNGRRSVPLASFLPLFASFAVPTVIDSVLYYWGFRPGFGEDDWFYAARYDFRTGRADTLLLFRDELEATEVLSLGRPPMPEGALIKYEYRPAVAWVDRDFRLSQKPGAVPETARAAGTPYTTTGAEITFTSITAGPRTCAVTSSGKAYCWRAGGARERSAAW